MDLFQISQIVFLSQLQLCGQTLSGSARRVQAGAPTVLILRATASPFRETAVRSAGQRDNFFRDVR
jgi:hypothetical protein